MQRRLGYDLREAQKHTMLEGSSANFVTHILALLWNNSEHKNTEESKGRKDSSKP